MVVDRPLALVGLRGSGKSTLGAVLAKELGIELCEMDEMLVQAHGSPIADWVAQEGWGPFRNAEAELVKSLSQKGKLIVSTGGGVITKTSSIEILRNDFTCFYLHWPVAVLVERIRGDDERPALKEGMSLEEEVQQLYVERDPLYRKASTHVIDCIAGESLDTTKGAVLKLLGQ